MPLLYHYLMPLLLAAGFYDLYWRRIPNAITLPLAIVGLLLQGLVGAGFAQAGMSMMLGGAVFFILYLAGMMGAGDVKLMMAVGAWLDVPATMTALVLTICAGGLMALAMVIAQAFAMVRSGRMVGRIRAATMPYGIAIAAGSMLALFIIR
jgi:prepilin peptidase CpaA